jgi:predicted Zn-dependent protease
MLSVFKTLDRISGTSGRGVPEWLSTHPNPGNRYNRTQQRVAAVTQDLDGMTVNRDGYLRRLDGMVFGENPRLGYFQGGVFYHPDLAFRLDFPNGWKTQNGTQAVVAGSPQNDAIIALTLAGQASPAEAAREFFAEQGIQARSTSTNSINGLRAVTSIFTADTQDGLLQGRVSFISYSGTTYRIMGYTPASVYGTYGTIFRRSIESFQRLTDRAALDVRPARVSIVRVPSRMTLEQFNRRFPSTIPLAQLALINGVEETTTLGAGQLVKRVAGGKLPGS